jgi:hypothetical protein
MLDDPARDAAANGAFDYNERFREGHENAEFE